jgi:hypothetical protein
VADRGQIAILPDYRSHAISFSAQTAKIKIMLVPESPMAAHQLCCDHRLQISTIGIDRDMIGIPSNIAASAGRFFHLCEGCSLVADEAN